jgi:hypothetical protein
MVGSSSLPRLPDIEEVRPVDATDQVVFDEVREVLERHGALQRFGLTLLHQHFGLEDREILAECIDKEHRTLTLQPALITDTRGGIETSWRLDDPVAQRRCEVVCEPIPQQYGGGHNRNHYTTS